MVCWIRFKKVIDIGEVIMVVINFDDYKGNVELFYEELSKGFFVFYFEGKELLVVFFWKDV